jgi:putative ABC transport system ATP-binding protein
MNQPVIRLEGVSKHYGEGPTRVDAVKTLDLDIHGGQVAGLLGPSGSGKSTVLNMIAAIVDPSGGRITLDGDVVFDQRWLRSDLRRLRLEKIGFIFQFHNLIPFLSVSENVGLVLHLAGWPAAKVKARVDELLEYLDVADKAGSMPAQLSGGQAQRVAIARALANRPRIILADEPTAALDSERAGIVMNLLAQVASDQKAAIVVVTHDDKVMNRFDVRHTLRDGFLVTS